MRRTSGLRFSCWGYCCCGDDDLGDFGRGRLGGRWKGCCGVALLKMEMASSTWLGSGLMYVPAAPDAGFLGLRTATTGAGAVNSTRTDRVVAVVVAAAVVAVVVVVAVVSRVFRLRGQRKRAGYVNSEFIICVAIPG